VVSEPEELDEASSFETSARENQKGEDGSKPDRGEVANSPAKSSAGREVLEKNIGQHLHLAREEIAGRPYNEHPHFGRR